MLSLRQFQNSLPVSLCGLNHVKTPKKILLNLSFQSDYPVNWTYSMQLSSKFKTFILSCWYIIHVWVDSKLII